MPTKLSTILAVIFLLTAGSASAQAVKWNVDANHSEVAFTARHLAFAKVRGKFTKFQATVMADAKTGRLESVDANAETSSVDTGNTKRDNHLRSDDFLDAANHPQLKLVTRSIKWNADRFTAQVDLTLRGITKRITFKGELLGVQRIDFGQGPHMRAAYEAKGAISRKEFGLKFSGLAEGVSIVGDEVGIHFTVEVSRPLTKG